MALTVKITGDNTLLKKALDGSTKMVEGFAAHVKSAIPSAGQVFVGLAAAAGGVTAAFAALQRTMATGSAFADLSARTGESVTELMTLEQAFRDVNLGSQDMTQGLEKLTKAVLVAQEGGNQYAKALEALGLRAEDLAPMGMVERLRAVAAAMAEAGDQGTATKAALELFGEAGGKMLAVFRNPRALTDAAQMLGSQAQIFERNAASFDRITDILRSAGVKLQGFTAGFAGEVAPRIEAVLEKFAALDFASQGAALGEIADSMVAAFEQGKLGEVLSLNLQIGLEKAAMFFRSRMFEVGQEAGAEMGKQMELALAKLGLRFQEMVASAVPFGAGKGIAAGYRGAIAGIESAQRQMSPGGAERIGGLEERLAAVMEEIGRSRDALRSASDAAGASRRAPQTGDRRPDARGAAPAELASAIPEVARMRLATSSLAARGGGGGLAQTNVLVTIQRQAQATLKSIDGRMKTMVEKMTQADVGMAGVFTD